MVTCTLICQGYELRELSHEKEMFHIDNTLYTQHKPRIITLNLKTHMFLGRYVSSAVPTAPSFIATNKLLAHIIEKQMLQLLVVNNIFCC